MKVACDASLLHLICGVRLHSEVVHPMTEEGKEADAVFLHGECVVEDVESGDITYAVVVSLYLEDCQMCWDA
jgi:hypothetical protein